MKERIVLSSDHAGFDLKIHLKPFIADLGYEVEDVGTFSRDPVDYPVYTYKATQKVVLGECRRGIIFCGTGQGDAIAANKVAGIRAALCWNEYTARMSRAHNNANMLVIGGWVTGHRIAEEMVRVWLATPFDGGRHERRLAEITDIERDMKLGRAKIYDITLAVRPGMLLWPGDAPVTFQKQSFEGVHSLTNLMLSAHAGTHLDAPMHILHTEKDSDSLELEALSGLARVCEVRQPGNIDRAALESLPLGGVTRLLLKTRNSDLLAGAEFEPDYAALTAESAEYLVKKGIKLVAIDYLSVDEYSSRDYPVHRALLEAGVAVVEGVDLRNVPAGDYELLCLPLKLAGSDGAPARVVLRAL